MKPWFSFPLEDWRKSVLSVRSGARTLKDPHLASELAELRAITTDAPDDLAARLMLKLYADEHSRRADPTMAFDDELDLVLGRLERLTTPEDRQRLTDIGLELHRLGGADALRATYSRVLELGEAKRRHVREKILTTRWSGIAAWRAAA